MPPFDDRVELEELKRQLDDHAEDIAHHLYGDPTSRRRAEYRWGRRGSVQLIRRKGGWRWRNYETGERGSIVDAIRDALGLDLSGTLLWARRWLRVGGARTKPRPRRRAPPLDVDEEQGQRCHQAVMIWQAGRPIKGTLAERYLRERRDIDAEFPADFARYVTADDVRRCRRVWSWWRWPALVVAATDLAGNVTGIQLIALEPDGSAALRFDGGGKFKLSLGKLTGSAVRLRQCKLGHNGGPPLDATAPLLLGEGFETVASAWWAANFEAWALLGSIAKADLSGVPVTRPIVILGDDDKRDAASNKALKDAIWRWRREGRTVLMVKPWLLTRGDKSDVNDLLRDEGREAVREKIMAALAPAMSQPELPTISEARRSAAHAIGMAIGNLRHWRAGQTDCDADEVAPFVVVRAEVGTGKTKIAIEHLVDAVAQGERIAYLVPTHRLSAETKQRFVAEFERQGVAAHVEVWRGREAANPDYPGEPMCAELDTVRVAQAAHLDVEQAVCEVCPHQESCPYLAQRIIAADIWVGAHELMLNPPPAPLKETTLVVIDEGFAHRLGFIGFAGEQLLLTREDILTEPSLKSAAETADLLADLMPLRRRLARALDSHPDGGLDRDRLLAAGLTADDAARAHGLEWREKVDPQIDGCTAWAVAKKSIVQAAEVNRGIGKRAMLWRAIEVFLRDDTASCSGRVIWQQHRTADGATFRALRLFDLEVVNEAWLRLPTLHLDATADLRLLRTRVPHAELAADIVASSLYMRVVQYTGKTFGKGSLCDTRTLNKVWSWAVAQASRRGGDWLIVMPKDAVVAITGTGTIPSFIRMTHFGALRGRDEYRDVAGIIIIGRPMPAPADVEQRAGVLSGNEVRHRVGDWYPAEIVHLRGKDGTAATVEADRHPDPLAEALRMAVAEDELLQAIGRVRGVNRTADNPVEVVLLGDVPISGLKLDSVQPWRAPSIDDEILAEHGVMFDAAAHAATVAGLTLRKVEGRRERSPPFPYKEPLYENGGNLREAVYHLAGAGHRPLRVRWDPRRVPDIRCLLEEKLGTLADFELVHTGSAVEQTDLAVEAVIALPLSDGLVEQVAIPLAAEDPFTPVHTYRGGPFPPALRRLSRERRRAAGISQQEFARRCSISRPQLANAEAGRFGLSPTAAARFLAVVTALPVRQQFLPFGMP